jgi:hypothetical protein
MLPPNDNFRIIDHTPKASNKLDGLLKLANTAPVNEHVIKVPASVTSKATVYYIVNKGYFIAHDNGKTLTVRAVLCAFTAS